MDNDWTDRWVRRCHCCCWPTWSLPPAPPQVRPTRAMSGNRGLSSHGSQNMKAHSSRPGGILPRVQCWQQWADHVLLAAAGAPPPPHPVEV